MTIQCVRGSRGCLTSLFVTPRSVKSAEPHSGPRKLGNRFQRSTGYLKIHATKGLQKTTHSSTKPRRRQAFSKHAQGAARAAKCDYYPAQTTRRRADDASQPEAMVARRAREKHRVPGGRQQRLEIGFSLSRWVVASDRVRSLLLDTTRCTIRSFHV